MTPGYPHHPGLHPAQSSMSRGTPGGASIATTPGSTSSAFDDDKGRGSYKCGRCGVPKKGHICPYQPKVKRMSDEPAPDMKCVSTQVEMDEFMTLRRLNIEIQGFPESYAAEPSDNCGTEIHSPHHHHVMTPSSYPTSSAAAAAAAAAPGSAISKPGMAPLSSGPQYPPTAMSTQGPPTSLPSLSSMPSQQPEQVHSSADGSTLNADVKNEESTATEEITTTTSIEKEVTIEDSTINVEENEELENDELNFSKNAEDENADNHAEIKIESAQESDDDDDLNKKRSSEENSGSGDDESPSKKQKV